jgi:DNA-binding transcriptional LysR family regulator
VDLRRLKYFVTLAEHLHFGRAAAALHIAQPALSQQIKVLERELGVQLLRRSSRGVALTEAGQLLLVEGRKLLRQTAVVTAKTRAAGGGESGTLRVAYTRSVPDLGPRELVERFRERHPQVAITTATGWTAHNVELLRADLADVGFVRLPLTDAPELRTLLLGYDELVTALPADHRLARRSRVSREALVGEPVVAWPRSQGEGFHDTILTEVWRGEHPRVVHEEPDAENILAAVAAGTGVAVLDRHRALRLRLPGVVVRRFSGEIPRASFGLAWRPDATPVAERFAAFCRDLVDRSGPITGDPE